MINRVFLIATSYTDGTRNYVHVEELYDVLARQNWMYTKTYQYQDTNHKNKIINDNCIDDQIYNTISDVAGYVTVVTDNMCIDHQCKPKKIDTLNIKDIVDYVECGSKKIVRKVCLGNSVNNNFEVISRELCVINKRQQTLAYCVKHNIKHNKCKNYISINIDDIPSGQLIDIFEISCIPYDDDSDFCKFYCRDNMQMMRLINILVTNGVYKFKRSGVELSVDIKTSYLIIDQILDILLKEKGYEWIDIAHH